MAATVLQTFGKLKADLETTCPQHSNLFARQQNSREVVSWSTIVRLVSLLPLIMGLFFSAGCQSEPERKKIDFLNREPLETALPIDPSKMTLRVAVAGVISPVETAKSYSQLISYLGRALHQPMEMVQRRTYAEINELVKSRYVVLAFVCSGAYVVGQEEFGMELLVVPQVNGETVYYSYIIVPANSSVAVLKDLKGKNFAFTDPMSNTGKLVPTYMLYQLGETPGSFFKRYTFTYSHDNSIKAVAENLVDGAAVDSLVYDQIVALYPDIATKTKIIARSLPFGIPPVVVHPSLNQETKAELRGLFLSMHRDETGREILRNLGIDRFVLASDRDYDTIRSMVKAVGW